MSWNTPKRPSASTAACRTSASADRVAVQIEKDAKMLKTRFNEIYQ